MKLLLDKASNKYSSDVAVKVDTDNKAIKYEVNKQGLKGHNISCQLLIAILHSQP